ncbi:hypothetical protein ACI78V_02600 [Geodermatophilus sp. SYSU D00742]
MSGGTGGGGQDDEADNDLTIVDADLATTRAHAAARVAFDTANRVLGCAGDPSSRPG